MNSDHYVTVITTLRTVRERSIYVDRRLGGPPGDDVCIPRSLLHAASDTAIERFGEPGTEITLKLRRWKAAEVGLIEAKDARQLDLLGGAASRRALSR